MKTPLKLSTIPLAHLRLYETTTWSGFLLLSRTQINVKTSNIKKLCVHFKSVTCTVLFHGPSGSDHLQENLTVELQHVICYPPPPYFAPLTPPSVTWTPPCWVYLLCPPRLWPRTPQHTSCLLSDLKRRVVVGFHDGPVPLPLGAKTPLQRWGHRCLLFRYLMIKMHLTITSLRSKKGCILEKSNKTFHVNKNF